MYTAYQYYKELTFKKKKIYYKELIRVLQLSNLEIYRAR